MAINSYNNSSNGAALGNVLKIVSTLGDLGIIKTPQAKQAEAQTQLAQQEAANKQTTFDQGQEQIEKNKLPDSQESILKQQNFSNFIDNIPTTKNNAEGKNKLKELVLGTKDEQGNFITAPASAAQIHDLEQSPLMKLVIDHGDSKVKNPGDELMRSLHIQKLQGELEEKAFKKTPEGKLQGMGAEAKKRLDDAKLGLVSVRGMSDALANGDNTFSIIGDNDFTQQRALFEESLGRMQSGGAISKGEEQRFKKMAPTFTDPAHIKETKLRQLENIFAERIGTLGFQPEQVGIAKSSPNQPIRKDAIDSAQAAQPKRMSEEDFINKFLDAKAKRKQ